MTKAIVVRSKAAIKRWQEARARGSYVPEYLREEKPCVHRTTENMQTEAEIQGEGGEGWRGHKPTALRGPKA